MPPQVFGETTELAENDERCLISSYDVGTGLKFLEDIITKFFDKILWSNCNTFL